MLNSMLANPNIRVRQSDFDPRLSVLKYKKQVFYKDTWTPELENARGLVIADGKIVAYPFTKIYNYGIEKRAPKFASNEPLVVQRKVNGFMAAISLWDGHPLVSTTGSVDSDFVGYVLDFLDDKAAMKVLEQFPHYTFMFECVHPSDPHIIEEEPGLYYLGCREKLFGSTIHVGTKQLADAFGAYFVESFTANIEEVKELAKVAKHEGYVMYARDNRAAKIKSPYYLISKWLARGNKPISRERVDEEFYPLLEVITPEFYELPEQQRLAFIKDFYL
jgi:hypothetical protein